MTGLDKFLTYIEPGTPLTSVNRNDIINTKRLLRKAIHDLPSEFGPDKADIIDLLKAIQYSQRDTQYYKDLLKFVKFLSNS